MSDKIDANDVAAAVGSAGLSVALDQAEEVDVVPTLRNFRAEQIRTKKGFTTIRHYVALPAIAANLKSLAAPWPKRVGDLPFYVEDGEAKLLDAPEKLFAFVQARNALSWGAGSDEEGFSLCTKQEFYSHVCQSNAFEQYRAIETLPHWPRLPFHFYLWEAPKDYTPSGEYLEKLLSFFPNCESAHDAAILKAMFLSPAWGGPYGSRPAFVLEAPDRGSGKTMAANVLGRLFKGYIDLELSRSGEEDLASRLLSGEGLTRRIVRIDNVKRQASSGLIENLITCDDISGKRLFRGEGSRPNVLVWILTANGLRMSRDMADRSFVVRFRRLTDQEKSSPWKSAVFQYVDENRDRILADIGQVLSAPITYPCQVSDRWPEFTAQVLAHCFADRASLQAAVSLNQDRRNTHDDELDEAQSIQERVDEGVKAMSGSSAEPFVSVPTMTEWVNEALNLRLPSRSVTHTLKEHIQAGRITRIRQYRTALHKGWQVDRVVDPIAPQDAQGRKDDPPAIDLNAMIPIDG